MHDAFRAVWSSLLGDMASLAARPNQKLQVVIVRVGDDPSLTIPPAEEEGWLTLFHSSHFGTVTRPFLSDPFVPPKPTDVSFLQPCVGEVFLCSMQVGASPTAEGSRTEDDDHSEIPLAAWKREEFSCSDSFAAKPKTNTGNGTSAPAGPSETIRFFSAFMPPAQNTPSTAPQLGLEQLPQSFHAAVAEQPPVTLSPQSAYSAACCAPSSPPRNDAAPLGVFLWRYFVAGPPLAPPSPLAWHENDFVSALQTIGAQLHALSFLTFSGSNHFPFATTKAHSPSVGHTCRAHFSCGAQSLPPLPLHVAVLERMRNLLSVL